LIIAWTRGRCRRVSSEDADEDVDEGFGVVIGNLGGTVDGGRLRLARVDANAHGDEDVGVDGDAAVDGVDDVGDEIVDGERRLGGCVAHVAGVDDGTDNL